MTPIPLRRRAAPVDRMRDRLVAASSMLIAAAFLAVAGLALLLPDQDRRGLWLPLHLALAGAATTAIAGVMPFFVAAFAAAPPADVRLRAAAVAAVAIGASGVASGVAFGPAWVGAVGGGLFIAGIALVGAATLRPLQAALGPARGLVTRAYVAALVGVAAGATLSTMLLAGWAPVVSNWARLKPAHAWLNLFAFVSLVIVTTLLHFFPTVVGARIPNRRSGRVAVIALAFGSWLVAIGYAAGIDAAVDAGCALAVASGLALAAYAWSVWRTRARWTTDAAWHAFAIGGLVSATFWFVVGLLSVAALAIPRGAGPAGWSIGFIIGPLVAGWVGLALVASATHLLPAVGPGDLAVHARQRRLLGVLAVPRLVVLDVGVGVVTIGQALGSSPVTDIGLILLGIAFGATVMLLAAAVAIGVRSPQPPPSRGAA